MGETQWREQKRAAARSRAHEVRLRRSDKTATKISGNAIPHVCLKAKRLVARAKSTNYFADYTKRAGHDLCFPVHDLSLESSASGKDLLPSVMDLLGE